MCNIAKEIKLFHEQTGMVHHDIKPDNIAVIDTKKFTVKLIDWGFSHEINNVVSDFRGPGIYRDKRLKTLSFSDPANDFYSLAFTFALSFLPLIQLIQI